MKTLSLSFVFSMSLFFVRAQQGQRMQSAAGLSDQANAKALAFYNQGVEYSNSQQYDKGIACYEQAIKLDTGYIDAYNNLGLDLYETNAFDSAAYYLQISLRKQAKNVPALTNLGLVEIKQSNFQGALEHFQQIEKLEPQNPQGYYSAAMALLNMGKLQDGLAAAKQAEKLFDAHSASLPDCHYLILVAYFNLQDKVNAKKYYDLCKKEHVDIDPQIVSAMQ